jgi:hypothetical protein
VTCVERADLRGNPIDADVATANRHEALRPLRERVPQPAEKPGLPDVQCPVATPAVRTSHDPACEADRIAATQTLAAADTASPLTPDTSCVRH